MWLPKIGWPTSPMDDQPMADAPGNPLGEQDLPPAMVMTQNTA
jgi:hypothetical protein